MQIKNTIGFQSLPSRMITCIDNNTEELKSAGTNCVNTKSVSTFEKYLMYLQKLKLNYHISQQFHS